MNEHFSIQRTWWLLRADFASGYRTLLTISATLAGVLLLASLISLDGPAGAQSFFVGWFAVMLFVWGAIASSRAFRELHDKSRNEAYLLIPASMVEKTVARLLATTVGLAIYLLIFTTVVSVVVTGLLFLIPGSGAGFFNPLDPAVLPLIAGYLFLQSFFFLGAAWFRRRHFIKTTLILTLAGITSIVLLLLTVNIAFSPADIANPDSIAELATGSHRSLMPLFRTLGKIFAILLPIACWTIAWLRVRETQVSDGI